MKLISPHYINPNPLFASPNNVEIVETRVVHKWRDKYLSIDFEMRYFIDDVKYIIGTGNMAFSEDSNETMYVQVEIEGVVETIKLMDWLSQNNGELGSAIIVEYGKPSYNDVHTYFSGGDFDNPEITLSNPIAQGFLLNKLIMNGQIVGQQFSFIEL